MTNAMGKTRPKETPYLIYQNKHGWIWRVLKGYVNDPNKKFARWFCDVSSPYTYPSSDLGDTYISDIKDGGGELIFRDPVVPDDLIPDFNKVVSAW